jgi:hypothetical protein
MANQNKTISELSNGSPAQPTDALAIARGGASLQVSASSIATLGKTINAQTGTSYGILDSDNGKIITFSNAADIAATIAQAGVAGAFASGWYTELRNISLTGTVILTPATSTISTATKVIIPPGGKCVLTSDGSNFIADEAEVAYMLGADSAIGAAINTTAIALVVNANEVWVVQFVNRVNRLLSKATYSAAVAGAGGSTITIGLYTIAGTKICDTGTFDATSTTAATNTFSKILLLRGSYFHASSATTATTLTGFVFSNTNTGGMWQSNGVYFSKVTTRAGTAANATSGGVLPTALGAITAAVNARIPTVMWE